MTGITKPARTGMRCEAPTGTDEATCFIRLPRCVPARQRAREPVRSRAENIAVERASCRLGCINVASAGRRLARVQGAAAAHAACEFSPQTCLLRRCQPQLCCQPRPSPTTQPPRRHARIHQSNKLYLRPHDELAGLNMLQPVIPPFSLEKAKPPSTPFPFLEPQSFPTLSHLLLSLPEHVMLSLAGRATASCTTPAVTKIKDTPCTPSGGERGGHWISPTASGDDAATVGGPARRASALKVVNAG
jgi:hypothetical protein